MQLKVLQLMRLSKKDAFIKIDPTGMSETVHSYRQVFRFSSGYTIITKTRTIPKHFPWVISEKVYLPVSNLSNRMMTSGLNNRRSKTLLANMS